MTPSQALARLNDHNTDQRAQPVNTETDPHGASHDAIQRANTRNLYENVFSLPANIRNRMLLDMFMDGWENGIHNPHDWFHVPSSLQHHGTWSNERVRRKKKQDDDDARLDALMTRLALEEFIKAMDALFLPKEVIDNLESHVQELLDKTHAMQKSRESEENVDTDFTKAANDDPNAKSRTQKTRDDAHQDLHDIKDEIAGIRKNKGQTTGSAFSDILSRLDRAKDSVKGHDRTPEDKKDREEPLAPNDHYERYMDHNMEQSEGTGRITPKTLSGAAPKKPENGKNDDKPEPSQP